MRWLLSRRSVTIEAGLSRGSEERFMRLCRRVQVIGSIVATWKSKRCGRRDLITRLELRLG